MEHDDHGHSDGHDHDHSHGHGHEHDRGARAMLRYLRYAPRMWSSDINDAVVDLVAPAPGERVVDIGAGMGPGTVRAAKAGASVVAVEPTPYMRGILTARRLAQRARGLITVVDAAAEDLPVADDSIDAVWAVNTMHHWVDLERGITEIARVLRPGGRMVLVDESFDDPSHPDYERFGSVRGDDHDHQFEMVDTERIGSLLGEAGLVDVDAGPRRLADRPILAVTARAPG
ncbi:MAG: class I SAM-dependent methyltransferase [Ilumatobacteraceae bacterium]